MAWPNVRSSCSGPRSSSRPSAPRPLERLGALVAAAPDLPQALVELELDRLGRELGRGIEVAGGLDGRRARGRRFGGPTQPAHGGGLEVLGDRLCEERGDGDGLAEVEGDEPASASARPVAFACVSSQRPASAWIRARSVRGRVL